MGCRDQVEGMKQERATSCTEINELKHIQNACRDIPMVG